MKYYISGKISNGGTEEHIFDYFNEKESELLKRPETTEVFNPARYEEEETAWEYYIARDVKWIMENRPKMYMLKNWKDSLGARTEHALAKALGLEIEYDLTD